MDELPDIRHDVPLAPLTTLGVGGPADFYCVVASDDALVSALRWSHERNQPVLILGGGSNLLVGDEGFRGIVLHVVMNGIAYREAKNQTEVTADAGVDWDLLVAQTVERGLAGIECLSGIPGRVGATPIQNVGAYGQEVAETISRVETIDLHSFEKVAFAGTECGFGYRHSRFKGADRGRYAVTRVTYLLAPGGAPALRYAELAAHFAERGVASPTLEETRTAVLEIRRRKAMVLDPADTDTRSAGSFFVNPIVDDATLARIPADAPRFAAAGGTKLSAAWLIEHAGFSKGHTHGRAGLSTRHALAIVNRGGATASEVVALAGAIRDAVRDRFGVTLTPEPVLIGVQL